MRRVSILLCLTFLIWNSLQTVEGKKNKDSGTAGSTSKLKRVLKETDKKLKAALKGHGSPRPPPEVNLVEPLKFKKAAVAADNYNCSVIGRRIMKAGGSAADAIIATHHCVECVHLHSTGLGGGGFILAYQPPKNGKPAKKVAIDMRETLPYNYKDAGNKTQGETILVPGVVKGLWKLHQKFGRLPWRSLFEPAIELARNGFRIHEALAMAIEKKQDFIHTNLGLRELFAPQGFLLRQGDILKRPRLAAAYEKLAEFGPDIFYKGELARDIISDVREAGGVMTERDLADYDAYEREPLQVKIKGLTMLSPPPPASGALISLILKIMEKFEFTQEDLLDNEKAPLTFHKMLEAMKFGYAPYSYLSDPRFNNNTDKIVQYMLKQSTADYLFSRVDDKAHTVDYYGPFSDIFIQEKHGTSHMSAVGPDGDAVSLTSSINAYFGSKLVSRTMGFIYNNELADFAEFWPDVYKLPKDTKKLGKRPMSKSSPIIFVDGKGEVKGVFGAAGGFFIPSCLSQTIANWLFFGDNLKIAISRPRVHCQLYPPTVVYEPTFPQDLVPKLKSFSHQYVTNSTYDVSGQLNAIMGVVQAIVRTDDGMLAAESDYRKGGLPAGF